ncbi:hypothetical protein [Streptomyces sp. NPDC029554]|uniref:hypothetical protein n=1 Tax=Streptomyces sp. NPDC029554 TaxID=3155126 RepID=UPI003407F198
MTITSCQEGRIQHRFHRIASIGGRFLVHGIATWRPICRTVAIRSAPGSRATAVGRASGMGRFGAVVGPWPGGQLLAPGRGVRASRPSHRRA